MDDLENLLDEAFQDLLNEKSKQGSAEILQKETPGGQEDQPTKTAESPSMGEFNLKDLLKDLTTDHVPGEEGEEMGSDPLESILRQFLEADSDPHSGATSAGLAGEGEDEFIETFVSELLSKDVLYEPLKELAAKYPDYLKNYGDALDKETRDRYELQFSYLQQLVQVWGNSHENEKKESEPSNGEADEPVKTPMKEPVHAELAWSLLQKIEACGQPPQEILP